MDTDLTVGAKKTESAHGQEAGCNAVCVHRSMRVHNGPGAACLSRFNTLLTNNALESFGM